MSVEELEITKRPTGFSLFSGCGGFDLGMKRGGLEIVGANEWDASATLTYMTNLCSHPLHIHYLDGDADKERLEKELLKSCKKNDKGEIVEYPISGSGWIKHHPEFTPTKNFWFGDVRKLKGVDILRTLNMERGELDCLFGGPPCQGFSYAGKRNIADPRNNLIYEFARLVVELQPKTFVLENVPGLANMLDPDGIPVLDKFAMCLEKGGYGKWETIKKSIAHQMGAVAVAKGMTKGDPKDNEKKESDAEHGQISFFDEGGAHD